MKQKYEVNLFFYQSGCFGWAGFAFNKMEAKSLARQEAIASGFKDDVKKITVEAKS